MVAAATTGLLVATGGLPATAGPATGYYYPVTASLAAQGDVQSGIAVDPGTDLAYVANRSAGTVSIIDLASGLTVANTPVGEYPQAVAVDPLSHDVFVPTYGDQTLSVLDGDPSSPHFGTVVRTTTVCGDHPIGVGVDPSLGTVLVSCAFSSLQFVDEQTGAVTGSVDTGSGGQGIAVDPASHTAYVTGPFNNTVYVVDIASRALTHTIPVGSQPTAVALDPTTGLGYVADGSSNAVSVFDTATESVTATIGVDGSPYSIAVDPVRQTVYVANLQDQSVSVIDTATDKVVTALGFPNSPSAVAVDPTRSNVLVGNFFGGEVDVVTPTPLVRATVTGVSPAAGTTAGGETVTITGSGFSGADRVLFGTTRVTSFTVVSDHEITATAPAHAAGVVAVRVHTLGLSAKRPAARYRFR